MSWFLIVIAFASGGLGLPLGMPPGPEDPMIGRFAAEDAQVYIAWTGVGKLDGDDPTTEWMEKPEIQAMVKKLLLSVRQLAPEQAEGEDNLQDQGDILQRLAIKATEASVYNGASIFSSGIRFLGREPEFDAAFLIPLADQKVEIQQLFDQLKAASKDKEESLCKFIQKEGQTRFIVQDLPKVFEVMLKDDYLLVGVGEGLLDQGLANMQSEPPKWFTDFRQRLAVKEFSSMAYLSAKVLDDVDVPFGTFPQIKDLKSICFVNGLDDEGAIARMAMDILPDGDLLNLLPAEPLQKHEMARMMESPLLGWQTRVPVDAIVKFIGEVGKQLGQDPVEEAETQFQEMFGISLQEELLDVFDGYVSVSLDFNPAANQPAVTTVFGIGNEMTFPAVYESVVDSVSQWPQVQERLEKMEHREYAIYEFTPPRMFISMNLCWAHADDQLIFASDIELVADQIDRLLDNDGGFADTQRAKQLVAFGKESGFGNPVAMTTLDPVKLMELYFHFVGMFGGGDDREVLPGFTMGDIPDFEVLSDGVDSSVNGIYRTPNGLEAFGRSTLPGSSPPVTLVAAGGVAFSRYNVAVRQRGVRRVRGKVANSLRQIGLACLNFESAFRKFPATGTKDADGKPLLSWRVHILPFIEENELYEKFHMDEPWDSEHNKALIKEMPKIYLHKDMKLADGKTVYLGVAGEDGVMGMLQEKSAGENGFANITDGSSNTLLAVAVEPSSAVIWSKPEDLDTEAGGEKVVEATDENKKGTTTVFCDGSIHVFDEVDADDWELLMDISDGEVIDIKALAK